MISRPPKSCFREPWFKAETTTHWLWYYFNWKTTKWASARNDKPPWYTVNKKEIFFLLVLCFIWESIFFFFLYSPFIPFYERNIESIKRHPCLLLTNPRVGRETRIKFKYSRPGNFFLPSIVYTYTVKYILLNIYWRLKLLLSLSNVQYYRIFE